MEKGEVGYIYTCFRMKKERNKLVYTSQDSRGRGGGDEHTLPLISLHVKSGWG